MKLRLLVGTLGIVFGFLVISGGPRTTCADDNKECEAVEVVTQPVCKLVFTPGPLPPQVDPPYPVCGEGSYRVTYQVGFPTGCSKKTTKWTLQCSGPSGACLLLPPGECPSLWQEQRQDATASISAGACVSSTNQPCTCTAAGPIEQDYGRVKCPGKNC